MTKPSLRHTTEIPLYVLSVVLNVLFIGIILYSAWTLWWLPESLEDTPWAPAARVGLLALLLLIPGLIIGREYTRAATRGTTVQLSREQFPDIYAVKAEFARKLELPRDPDIYLANGNGTLNAFAASAFGHDFIVISNALFANLYRENRDGLAFIIGHELGHIKLGHTALWYQLSIAFVDRVPLLGGFLSRAREYSSDRCGAYLAPHGEEGMLILTAGRYVYTAVNTRELLVQAREFHGFWPAITQLPSSHPYTLNRLRILYDLKLLGDPRPDEPPDGIAAPAEATPLPRG
jgi:Zn-dependent protease with chaperone function